jgi:hypothetical protein
VRGAARGPALAWFAAATLGLVALTAEVISHSAWLKPSAERSPFSWAAAVAIFVGAGCVVVLARRGRGRQRVVLAILLVVIGLDEAFGLHERFAADLDVHSFAPGWSGVALAVEAALLAVAALLLALEARVSREALLVGGVALLAIALTARFAGGALAALHQLPTGEPRRAGEATIEGMALSGWVLVAAGLLGGALTRGPERPAHPRDRRATIRGAKGP